MKIQWLRYQASCNYEIKFKETINNEFPFNTVNIKKRTSKKIEELPLLYPLGRKIDQKKFADLQELLPFVPPVCHDFYRKLQISGEAVTNTNEEEDPLGLYNCEQFEQPENGNDI